MILLIMTLWSLCAIYFTRLFFRNGMKVAATALVTLYLYVVVWIYLLLFIDIGGVGFNLTVLHSNSIRYGEIYRAFNEIAVKMNQLSNEFLISLIMISFVVALCAVLVVLVGSIRVTKEIRRIIKSSNKNRKTLVKDVNLNSDNLLGSKFVCVLLLRMYCRANC